MGDNIGRGVQVSLSRAVQQQADAAPLIAVTKDKIEAIKVDNLKLYSQLERLEEAVKFADKEGGKDLELSKSYSVKLDFMTAKEKQYKTSLEKHEISKAEAELEELTSQLNINIASVHL